jgi:hypothetical protein
MGSSKFASLAARASKRLGVGECILAGHLLIIAARSLPLMRNAQPARAARWVAAVRIQQQRGNFHSRLTAVWWVIDSSVLPRPPLCLTADKSAGPQLEPRGVDRRGFFCFEKYRPQPRFAGSCFYDSR